MFEKILDETEITEYINYIKKNTGEKRVIPKFIKL